MAAGLKPATEAYRAMDTFSTVAKPSEAEIDARFPAIAYAIRHGAYFHATRRLEQLDAILASKRITDMGSAHYPGAFVSNFPERLYGRIILIFNRAIEGGELASGFFKKVDDAGTIHYWAGFKGSIPIESKSLLGVLIAEPPSAEINRELSLFGTNEELYPTVEMVELVKERFEKAGLAVPVLSLKDKLDQIQMIFKETAAVPASWPGKIQEK